MHKNCRFNISNDRIKSITNIKNIKNVGNFNIKILKILFWQKEHFLIKDKKVLLNIL